MAEDYIEMFNKIREQSQQCIAVQTKKKTSYDVVDLCGKYNLGYTQGVYVFDSHGAYMRIICGHRKFITNKEMVEKYHLPSYALELCDAEQYQGLTPENAELVRNLTRLLTVVKDNFDAFGGKIGKYPPTYSKHLTIQYMKITLRSDLNGNTRDKDNGMKVITSRSDGYFKAFDRYIESQKVGSNGDMSFIGTIFDRSLTTRNTRFMIQVTKPEIKYEFMITTAMGTTMLKDEDLARASDLNKEVVDITPEGFNAEELRAWERMFTEEFDAVKTAVYKNASSPVLGTPVSEPKVEGSADSKAVENCIDSKVTQMKVENVMAGATAEEDDDNPFA